MEVEELYLSLKYGNYCQKKAIKWMAQGTLLTTSVFFSQISS